MVNFFFHILAEFSS